MSHAMVRNEPRNPPEPREKVPCTREMFMSHAMVPPRPEARNQADLITPAVLITYPYLALCMGASTPTGGTCLPLPNAIHTVPPSQGCKPWERREMFISHAIVPPEPDTILKLILFGGLASRRAGWCENKPETRTPPKPETRNPVPEPQRNISLYLNPREKTCT